MADEIAEFLRARLDEDEATAQAAANRRWRAEDNIISLYPEHENDGFLSWPTRADARHAALHDPARVLREVAAKRAILDLADEASGLDMAVDGDRRIGSRDTEAEPYLGDQILRLLALSYSDHPDYQPHWKLEPPTGR